MLPTIRAYLACSMISVLSLFACTLVIPEVAQAQYRTVSKSCSRCGGSVSISSKVGDRCPHCGAVWVDSRSTYSSSFSSEESESPTPLLFSFGISQYSSGFIDEKMSSVYANHEGSSYGADLGVGGDDEGKCFVMLRYRHFTKKARRSAYDWRQYFIELGVRYCGIKPVFSFVHPFFGGGVGYTKIDYGNIVPKNPNGPGLYLEAGVELRLNKRLSLAGTMEYATYLLVYGDDYETLGTDGGLYPRVAFIVSFTR